MGRGMQYAPVTHGSHQSGPSRAGSTAATRYSPTKRRPGCPPPQITFVNCTIERLRTGCTPELLNNVARLLEQQPGLNGSVETHDNRLYVRGAMDMQTAIVHRLSKEQREQRGGPRWGGAGLCRPSIAVPGLLADRTAGTAASTACQILQLDQAHGSVLRLFPPPRSWPGHPAPCRLHGCVQRRPR